MFTPICLVRDVGRDAELYARLCEALGRVGNGVIAAAGCYDHTIWLNLKRIPQAKTSRENLFVFGLALQLGATPAHSNTRDHTIIGAVLYVRLCARMRVRTHAQSR
jgi:hypothetical protein